MIVVRSRILLLVVIIVSLACGGGGGSDTGGGTGGNPALQDKIVVVSDSVGSGFNASIKFPDVLAQRTGLPIVNFSVPGQSAEQGVSFIPGLITKEKPRYLVVLLGLNNAAGSARAFAGSRVQGSRITVQ